MQLAPSLQVAEVNDRVAFLALEREWNALVEAVGDTLFYRHEFLRIWMDNFAPRTKPRILTARDAGGRLVAALPLMEERAFLYGVPVRQLVATANPHSCRFDVIALDAEAAGGAFFEHLARNVSWD